MKGLFVVGTDTGVGKTVLCAALLAGAPSDLVYWKPVQTGAGTGDDDATTVGRLAGLEPDRIVPTTFRFAAAASPHHAALLEGGEVRIDALVAEARGADRPGRRWVVEGVGGLLVPLGPTALLTDLVRALGLPVLLASSTRLGTINHTLLTARALERESLPALGVVLVGDDDASARTAFADHLALPVLARLPRLERVDRVALGMLGRALRATAPIARALS